jgi:transposase
VQRAKIILLIASGRSQWAVSRQLGCSINTVRLWLKRFMEERLAGLFSRIRLTNHTVCQIADFDG